MRYDITTRQQQRVQNAMTAHMQLLSSLVELKLADFEDIISPIKALEVKTIRVLFMNLKATKGNKLCTVIERL